MRMDSYLWSVRIYKTKRLATEACKKGRVKVLGNPVKPGKEVKIGWLISVKKGPVLYEFKVLDFPKSRVGAKLVSEFVEDRTDYTQLEVQKSVRITNKQGYTSERPTKKDRRTLDRFKNSDS